MGLGSRPSPSAQGRRGIPIVGSGVRAVRLGGRDGRLVRRQRETGCGAGGRCPGRAVGPNGSAGLGRAGGDSTGARCGTDAWCATHASRGSGRGWRWPGARRFRAHRSGSAGGGGGRSELHRPGYDILQPNTPWRTTPWDGDRGEMPDDRRAGDRYRRHRRRRGVGASESGGEWGRRRPGGVGGRRSGGRFGPADPSLEGCPMRGMAVEAVEVA